MMKVDYNNNNEIDMKFDEVDALPVNDDNVIDMKDNVDMKDNEDAFRVKFDFVLDFLFFIEKYARRWRTKKLQGRFHSTCGYTAPGIVIILLYFDSVPIKNRADFNRYIQNKSIDPLYLGNVINEVIGNFLDLSPEIQ